MKSEKNNQPIDLTDEQKLAVGASKQDVLITAGPGSGKTLTLVERYVALLGQGFSPREVAAITFTEKAAREMRNRVRKRVSNLAKEGEDEEQRRTWQDVEAKLDAARIGTIHSLCAEILRSHPAQARLDPDFEVIEEGLSAALKTRAIDDVLIWTTGHPENSFVFEAFSPGFLRHLLRFLLDRRLDVVDLLQKPNLSSLGEAAILNELIEIANTEELVEQIRALKQMKAEGRVIQDGGENLAAQVDLLLNDWEELIEALSAKDIFVASRTLFHIRREGLSLRYGKKASEAKELVRKLQSFYDRNVNPWIGGKNKGDPLADESIEATFAENLSRIAGIFSQTEMLYQAALETRYALDFDDLESKALDLLKLAAIRERWKSTLKTILVDEYQDTNQRQQEIINQLSSEPGSLFIVGDARQSIYRFRGAKVTVFREMEEKIKAQGGEGIELDITFRAHPRMLSALEDLCSPILGMEDGPSFRVPFTPLRPDREDSREGIEPPFVEVVCGLGSSADDARPITAQATARRLIELRDEAQVTRWDDVALLFRASTGFQFYEDAFESAGIPFVTVAGRGFYDRPEIRDVLNMLRAIADPTDDAAMAGVLRSPAFGLSDEALYYLRLRGDTEAHFWDSLHQDLSVLEVDDRARAERARITLQTLIPYADRLPIAELLSELILRTDYRAALATAHSRMWRNLDKLLGDAHKSGLVRVRSFLNYIQTLRDVGAREGEAPVEEHGSVRLMTVHKAKGLEFNVVVLADASRMPRRTGQIAYLLPETGLAVRADRVEASSLVTRLAHHIDARESDAEEDRLLYVALTRTREKLLISGHVTETRSGLRTDGWLKQLFEVMGVEAADIVDDPGSWKSVALQSGELVGIRFDVGGVEGRSLTEVEIAWQTSSKKPLHHRLPLETERASDPDELADPVRDWRATGERVHAPAAAVGFMVHEAISRNLIPVRPGTGRFLTTLALGQGLVEEGQRSRAVQESKILLERLSLEPRWDEIEKAAERYHELPFSIPQPSTQPPVGTIDLLYKTDQGWKLVDFKTDELLDEDDLDEAIKEHREQVNRYKKALQDLLQIDANADLCFLDYKGKVEWVNIT